MKFYRHISLSLGIVFAVVGLLFLFIPERILIFFNSLSALFGMAPAPMTGFNSYLILAAGYMYLVALLAWLMFRHPENRFFPFILMQGKLASSVLSFGFFFFHKPLLIYFTNGVVDGIIGLVVLGLYFALRRQNA
jgi:hypothetical protein